MEEPHGVITSCTDMMHLENTVYVHIFEGRGLMPDKVAFFNIQPQGCHNLDQGWNNFKSLVFARLLQPCGNLAATLQFLYGNYYCKFYNSSTYPSDYGVKLQWCKLTIVVHMV